MKCLLLISLFAIGGCARDDAESIPTNGWGECYAIGLNADGVPCKSNLATGVETPLTADELKPCDIEIKLPIYGPVEGGAE